VSHPTLGRVCTVFAAISALGIYTAAGAQAAGPEEEEAGSRISGILQFDFTNAYIFRGIMQERDGFIMQPWGELYLSAYQAEEGFLRDFTVGLGVWNSVQSEKTLAEHSPRILYETDLYPLLSFTFPYGLSLTTTYYWYTSPNGGFKTAQELDLKFAWDDSEALGRYSLQPWVNLAIETHRSALGDAEGEGVQLGVAPTLYTFDHPTYPISITIPLEVGLSIDDYYERDNGDNSPFGYFSWGLAMSVPLAFVPARYGTWSFLLSGKGFYFGNTLQQVNHGDSLWPLGVASLSLEF
jgi:hypothetical protein